MPNSQQQSPAQAVADTKIADQARLAKAEKASEINKGQQGAQAALSARDAAKKQISLNLLIPPLNKNDFPRALKMLDKIDPIDLLSGFQLENQLLETLEKLTIRMAAADVSVDQTKEYVGFVFKLQEKLRLPTVWEQLLILIVETNTLNQDGFFFGIKGIVIDLLNKLDFLLDNDALRPVIVKIMQRRSVWQSIILSLEKDSVGLAVLLQMLLKLAIKEPHVVYNLLCVGNISFQVAVCLSLDLHEKYINLLKHLTQRLKAEEHASADKKISQLLYQKLAFGTTLLHIICATRDQGIIRKWFEYIRELPIQEACQILLVPDAVGLLPGEYFLENYEKENGETSCEDLNHYTSCLNFLAITQPIKSYLDEISKLRKMIRDYLHGPAVSAEKAGEKTPKDRMLEKIRAEFVVVKPRKRKLSDLAWEDLKNICLIQLARYRRNYRYPNYKKNEDEGGNIGLFMGFRDLDLLQINKIKKKLEKRNKEIEEIGQSDKSAAEKAKEINRTFDAYWKYEVSLRSAQEYLERDYEKYIRKNAAYFSELLNDPYLKFIGEIFEEEGKDSAVFQKAAQSYCQQLDEYKAEDLLEPGVYENFVQNLLRAYEAEKKLQQQQALPQEQKQGSTLRM